LLLELAREASVEKGTSKASNIYTVSDAVTAYLRWYAIHREAFEDTTRAINAHILPPWVIAL
jgi:hypothetical protein